MLQIRNFLARHLTGHRRNHDYSLSQRVVALTGPIILGLDRIETASLLRSNGTLQFLTGRPRFPDPQTLRRFLLSAPASFAQQMRRVNDRLLQFFPPLPHHRSRWIFDRDSPVVTVFGQQEGASVGYNPRYRGQRSSQPLLCVEANSTHLWGPLLRSGKTDPHSGTADLFRDCCSNLPLEIRAVRARADAGFYNDAFFLELEDREVPYAVVAKVYPPRKRHLPGISYPRVNSVGEMGEGEYRAHPWREARRHVVARRLLEDSEATPTLFTWERYPYRCWVTHRGLTPAGVQHFYDGRATIEIRIRELREDFALANVPTRAFAAHALYWEIVRLAYNLLTAFQRTCLPQEWQSYALPKLRHKLFLLPGELIRPQNRPLLRLHQAPNIESLAEHILTRLHYLSPLA